MSFALKRYGISTDQFVQYAGQALESSNLQLVINSHSQERSFSTNIQFQSNRDEVRFESKGIKVIFRPSNNETTYFSNLIAVLIENNQPKDTIRKEKLQQSNNNGVINFINLAHTWSISFKTPKAGSSENQELPINDPPKCGSCLEASYWAPIQVFCKIFLKRTLSEIHEELQDSEESTESTRSIELKKSYSSFTDLSEEMEEFSEDRDVIMMDMDTAQ